MAVVSVREGASTREIAAVINGLATVVNELKTDYNALLAKLDADSGVNDTDFEETLEIEADDANTIRVNY